MLAFRTIGLNSISILVCSSDPPAMALRVALPGTIFAPGLTMFARLDAEYQKYKLCHGNRALLKNGSANMTSTYNKKEIYAQNGRNLKTGFCITY